MGLTKDQPPQTIDWADLRFAVLVGLCATAVKVVQWSRPEWHAGGSDAVLASVLTVGYMLHRARRQPEKLDDWGITTPLRWGAIVAALLLLLGGGVFLAVLGYRLAGRLDFEPDYVPKMVAYILAAFPQQFYLCSVGLVSLATLGVFRGWWRLPLFVGLVFAAAHFWTPHRIPGTIVPVQVVLTFPMGFLVAWYFLRFRTIVPLVVCHAVLYVLLNEWVEAHL